MPTTNTHHPNTSENFGPLRPLGPLCPSSSSPSDPDTPSPSDAARRTAFWAPFRRARAVNAARLALIADSRSRLTAQREAEAAAAAEDAARVSFLCANATSSSSTINPQLQTNPPLRPLIVRFDVPPPPNIIGRKYPHHAASAFPDVLTALRQLADAALEALTARRIAFPDAKPIPTPFITIETSSADDTLAIIGKARWWNTNHFHMHSLKAEFHLPDPAHKPLVLRARIIPHNYVQRRKINPLSNRSRTP